MNQVILTINGYLWGLPMIAFLFCTHLLMTVKTGVIQRKTLKGIKLSLTKARGAKNEISPFAALATSLASTLGTGNIIGVATAISMGGAGAVFWCWLTGIFAMATQYAECVLAVRYRENTESGFVGGTMYVLKKGLQSPYIGGVYAFLAALGGVLTGAAIQSNAMSSVITSAVGDNVYIGNISLVKFMVGSITAILTALVVFGGIDSISTVCSRFVPLMALLYALGCFAVLFINRSTLSQTTSLIISEAFSLKAVAGGAVGSTMLHALRFGMARGLLSNEAGLGTSSVVSAAANTPNPVRQGLVAMTATFWDTVVMCLVTGIVIVSTNIALPGSMGMDSSAMCLMAFSQIGYVGEIILVLSMVLFAFSTVLGWSFTGLCCAQYIGGVKCRKPYLCLWVFAVFVSPHMTLDVVWNLADFCNAFLAVPNVYALIMLGGEVSRLTKQFVNKPDEVCV